MSHEGSSCFCVSILNIPAEDDFVLGSVHAVLGSENNIIFIYGNDYGLSNCYIIESFADLLYSLSLYTLLVCACVNLYKC